MAIRKDIKAARGVLCSQGKEIEEQGCSAEKLSSYATFTNSYIRLLSTRKTRTKGYDPEDGDPTYYEQLLKA